MASERQLHGLTIPVVDDHRDTVDMFREYLPAAGANVLEAGSAKDALSIVETLVIDAAGRLSHAEGRLIVPATTARLSDTICRGARLCDERLAVRGRGCADRLRRAFLGRLFAI